MRKKTGIVGFLPALCAAAALVGAAGAARAAWQTTTSLPYGYVITKTVASGGYLYQFGGLGDKGICGAPDVYYAPLNADGTVGAWTPTSSLPGVGTSTVTITCNSTDYQLSDIIHGYGYDVAAVNGYLYLMGGNVWNFNGFDDGNKIHFTNQVLYAQTHADGSLGPWTPTASLPFDDFQGAATASGGVIYFSGGRDLQNNFSIRLDSLYARPNADGSISAWLTSASPLPLGLYQHAASVAGGRLYISGGVTYDPVLEQLITNGVYSAPLAADGAPGAWRLEALLPTGLASHGLKTRHGILYTVGGQEPDSPGNSVHVSSVNADGTLQAWGNSDFLPTNIFRHGVAAAGDSLYAAGGSDSTQILNSVYQLRDAVPPSAVADLSAAAVDSATMRLQWSAPGNDGIYGSVAGGSYQLRVSTSAAGLNSAAPAAWPASFDAGQAQARQVSGLTGGVTYFFSLRATDASGNAGPDSNVASAATLPPPPPNPVPLAFGLSPASALTGSGAFTLTVNGSGFAPGAAVQWNGAARPTAFVNASQVTAAIASGDVAAAGTAAVAVFNPAPGGGLSAPLTFAVNNPVPAVASLTPNTAVAGGAAFTLTVDGAGFVSGSGVRWNGSSRPTTFVSASRLTAAVTAADIASAGSDAVSVVNPGPGGGASAPAAFTVGSPVPSVSALSPASALAGAAGFTLTVNGSGFTSATTVQWNGSARPTAFVGASQLSATISASDVASAGTAAVTAFTPAPGGGTSAPASFTINNPAPAVSSLSPAGATAGAAAFTLTVNGSGFVAGSAVRWNGTSRPTAFANASQLTATISSADVAAAGSASVTVFNAAPGGGASASAAFAISNPAPSIASLSPNGAIAGGAAFTLTVDGAGFVPGSTVQWNGSPRAAAYVGPTRLTAAISAADIASAGADAVTVTNPAPGGGTSAPAAFTAANPAPAVASLSPNSAVAGSAGVSVSVSGSGFTPATVAQWNGSARTTSYVGPTQLAVAIPASDLAAAGAAAVTAFTPAPGGGTSAPASFTINNPAPAVSALTPAQAVAGGAAFTLTVDGSGFVPGSVVRWNGADRTTSFTGSSRVTAEISAADVAAAGSASVAVFNPAPGGGLSSAASFTIAVPPPSAPVLSSISPASAVAGSGGATLTVAGSAFAPVSVVLWNGASLATAFDSESRLTASVPASALAAAGSAVVTVFTPAPGGGTSGPATFTIENPAPSASSLTPASALAGSAGLTLTVDGSGFAPASSVRWNGAARPTTFVSAARLTAALSASDLAEAGTAAVSVVTPAPGGGASAPLSFTVANPAPAVASLSPDSSLAGAAALTVAVTGSGFVPSSVVRWNGADRPTTYAGASQLSAAISAADAAQAGVFAVTVFTPGPGGGTSGTASFTVANPAPSVSGLTPASAVAGSAPPALTVNGAGFTAGSSVLWNGAARTTAFVSATSLSIALTAADVASAGSNSVAVVTPAPGGGTSAAAAFTVENPAPALASLTPAGVTAGAADFALTVDGSGFVPGSVVRWNGADRATTFVSAGRLTAAISAADAASAGVASVAVFTPAPGGGLSAAASFTVGNPAPVLSSLSPASAVAGQAAFALIVAGSGFVPGSTVQWNGAARPTSFVSAAELTASVSAADVAAAGASAVTVVTPAPGGGTSASASFATVNPAPSVASLTPASAAAGSSAFTLTVNGAGFVAGSVVRWNGADRATTFVSASRLDAAVSAADVAAAGSASVTAFSPAPGGGTSGAASFTIAAPQPPAALSFTVRFNPRTLNLKSNGNFVKAVLQGARGEDADDVAAASLAITAVDGAPVSPVSIVASSKGDDDDDGIEDDDLSFDRAAVEALLTPGTRTLTLSGAMRDGRSFTAEGTIEVIDPGAKKSVAARRGAALESSSKPSFWPAPKSLLAYETTDYVTLQTLLKIADKLKAADGAIKVRMPDGAAPPALEVTISTSAAESQPDVEVRRIKTDDAGLVTVSSAVVFGPEGTRFAKPVTLEIPYERRKLPRGMTEASLAVHYWNPATEQWEALPSIVDRQAQIVRAQTTHFSLYQVLSVPPAPARRPGIVRPAGAPAFSDFFAFPNPARGRTVTFRSQAASADTVSVRVYDLSGRRVFEGASAAAPNFDNVWDVGGVGSGVYIYVLTAHKAGEADAHAKGRVGVIK